MTRVSRNELLHEGCYAHVISHSIRKLKIFRDDEDFLKFKGFLVAAKRKAQFKLFHYCVMQTHFHLVVGLGNIEEFSFAIRDMKRSYVYWFHEKYRLSGPVWRARFKSPLIENEQYLHKCGQYIENNPLRAGLAHKSQDWPYSSARHYFQNISDDAVDSYEYLPEALNGSMIDREEFEVGSVIGSSFFRFQFLGGRKSARRVP